MKIVCMIPARMGSQRVKKKNLRLLNNIPLVCYPIRAAKEAGCFDEIYINSEADIFEEIAENEGIAFYKRPSHLASNTATNDQFVAEFLDRVDCDAVVQLLPTSPFLSSEEVANFTQTMAEYDTLIAVHNQQIECIYRGEPINFVRKEETAPSQTLSPIQVYACSPMGWKRQVFLDNIEKYDAAYHGGDGKTGTFLLKGFATVDIDNEEDFQLAEAIVRARKNQQLPQYYGEDVEIHVPNILEKDGIVNNDFSEENKEITNLRKLVAENREGTWSKRLINTPSNSMTVIQQLPGEGNRRHYHPAWDEWWYILKGRWHWEVEDTIREVKEGDIVLIERGKWHRITAVGNTPAIRLAVSREDVPHVYTKS